MDGDFETSCVFKKSALNTLLFSVVRKIKMLFLMYGWPKNETSFVKTDENVNNSKLFSFSLLLIFLI